MFDAMTAKDIVYAGAILVMAGWTAWKEVTEHRMAKRYGLEDNPKRCQEHGEAIASIKTDIEAIKEDIREIKAVVFK